jgi:WD40 repeat protein
VDIASGETIRYRKDNGEHFIFSDFGALSPDGKKLLLGSRDENEYMIWDIESGEEEWVKTPTGMLSFAVSPDGLAIACGRQNGVDLYRLGTGQKIKTFPLIQTNVNAASGEILYSDTVPYINEGSIAFSPSGVYFSCFRGAFRHQ